MIFTLQTTTTRATKANIEGDASCPDMIIHPFKNDLFVFTFIKTQLQKRSCEISALRYALHDRHFDRRSCISLDYQRIWMSSFIPQFIFKEGGYIANSCKTQSHYQGIF